ESLAWISWLRYLAINLKKSTYMTWKSSRYRLCWRYAQLWPVLFGRQGPGHDRRPVDPAGDQGASSAGPVPVHRPEERAARYRHQPALRPPPRAGGRGTRPARGGRTPGRDDAVPSDRGRRRARAGARGPRRVGDQVH